MRTHDQSNPYGHSRSRGTWLKGSLHVHSKEGSPCGTVPYYEVLSLYRKAGYDFLSFSEHLWVGLREHDGLILIPGMEWNERTDVMVDREIVPLKHAGLYGVDGTELEQYRKERTILGLFNHWGTNPQDLLILNHPNWGLEPHWSLSSMREVAQRVDGIEIFNGVISRLEGSPWAVREWDVLLSEGYRLWGIASDDFHWPEDLGKGWIMVRAASASVEGILGALKRGNFYCSTGLLFEDLRVEEGTFAVCVERKATLRGIGPQGEVLKEIRGKTASFPIPQATNAYIRVEAEGEDGSKAWTQPLWGGA